ncbi:MAG: hypothetical protein QGH70_11015 [Nitrospinota bacterium]|jgi:hypothetical protein|nr:hypothetical protein [Nitrospinota bacterium]MDP6484359.1 hypothetical protein [Nitrospinota bacterium]
MTAPRRLGPAPGITVKRAARLPDPDWHPTISLDEGIAESVRWVRGHLDVLRDLPTESHFEP